MKYLQLFGTLAACAALTAPVDATEARAVAGSGRDFDFICSTEEIVQQWGESQIIDQASWKLERFLANPIALYQHDIDNPIGSASNVRVEGGKLRATLTISSATESANQIHALLQEKTLRAVSVRFRPGRVVEEIRDGKAVTVFYDCELFEISVVTLPADWAAVMESNKRELDELRSEVAPTLGDVVPPVVADVPATITRAAEGAPADAVQLTIAECTRGAESSTALVEACSRVVELLEVAELPGHAEDFAEVVANECREAAAYAKISAFACSEMVRMLQGDARSLDMSALQILRAAVTKTTPIKDVERQLVEVTSERTSLATRVAELDSTIAKRNEEDIARDVAWILRCGTTQRYGVVANEASKKALMSLRRSDPTGFAETYKPALDGLRAFDPDFVGAPTLTTRELSTTPQAAHSSPLDDSDARVDNHVKRQADAGRVIPRSLAIQEVARGLDL